MEGAFAVLERLCEIEERKAGYEERVALALERLTNAWNAVADSPVVVAGRKNRGKEESKQLQAMRLLHELGPDNLTRIAERVDVHRRTLNKWASFMEAVERMRAAEQWLPREPRAERKDDL